MNRQLVILTREFPDPLLEKELSFLAGTFENVYLLPGTVRNNGDTILPDNVTVEALFDPVDLGLAKRLLWKHFFGVCRIYAWTIFRRGNLKLYLKHYRSFLGHLLLELEKIGPLEKFVRDRKLENALFYDYWMVDSTLALAELKRRGIIRHAIARSHGFDLYDERQFEKKVSFREYRVRFLDAVFTISNHGYQYLRERLPASQVDKVHLSYLGIINDQKILPPPKQEDRYTIVSCAYLIPLKRIRLLAEVLKGTSLDIHWIHFGDGPQRQVIEKKVSELPGNVTVTLKGETSNAEVMHFYAHHPVDLFVSLSESEGLPVSMIEAISYGIPVFACSINGIPEIVNDTTGKLVPVHIPASALLEQLENTLQYQRFDREVIRQFFRQKFDATANYSQFMDKIGRLYDVNLNAKKWRGIMEQQCSRCVLDKQDDPAITFDDQGVCSYCRQYEVNERLYVKKDEDGKQILDLTIRQIKEAGVGKKYDCILGVSGGVDSTYLAYQAKQAGLRPLAVHFDNGWNSELAVNNIEQMVRRLDMDLHTFVVDWEEFRDLQLSFFKASVIDIELPTDHAMLATLYKLAIKHNIGYILSGHNIVTESVLPTPWYFNKRDHIHITAIHKQFGTVPLKTFPLLTPSLKFRVEWERIRSIGLLNYMPYNKADVKQFITRELGWRDYGGKHYESIFTRFYQGYVLVMKFGVDKRKAHLSNLICSRQITKGEALSELQKPPYDEKVLAADYDFVLKKLQLTRGAFEAIMSEPPKKHTDYPFEHSIYDQSALLKFLSPGWRLFKKIRERVIAGKR
ncbi:MAG TPA: N-acetyl sugar amidotransferase [Ohtaekwangia sp.]|nr:N-acetyl sugar amidotransferase [Ohtaekwangia sp.]